MAGGGGLDSGTSDFSANYSSPAVDNDDDSSDSTYVSTRVVFAAILFVGLAANCALVVYVLRGQRRHGSRDPPQLNLVLVAIHAAGNVVNGLSGGIWLAYAAAAGRDDPDAAYTTLGCRFDAAAVQLIAVIHVVGLALMSVDRLVSVRDAAFVDTERRGLAVRTTAILVAVAWLAAIALSLPLLVPDGVEVEGVSQRYLCTTDSRAAPGYVWTAATVGCVVPLGLSLIHI